MSFPNTLTGALDGVTEIVAAHLNNLEEKVGIDNSLDPASLDYMLRNTASLDPGHKHTAGAFSGGINGDVFFRDADSIWKPGSPDTANLVAKTGGQTIAGVKTFTEIPILPASDPTADNEATRKGYVNAQDALKVSKAGDTMSGNLGMGTNNITDVGTLEADVAELTTPLAGIYGGTGLAAITPGDILYGDACSNTLIALAKAAAGNVLLSGDAPSWGKVALAAMADIATGTLLGRNTAGAGIPEVITDIPTAITIGGAYVYRAGGTDVAVADGGTNLSAYTAGDILYASAETTLAKLAKAAAGNVLLSGDAPSWGKVGLTTHVDGVLPVANGGTGGANAWTTAQDPGHKHSKLWASDGDPEAVTVDAAGNVMVGASAVGDSAAKVVGLGLGTAPSTNPEDMFHMWAADIAAGNCAPHFATELGKVIKLYQQSHIADAKVDYTGGDLDSEAEVIAAFNATNGKINSMFAVLENLGFLATS